jgi:membrane-bound serine protease (ClpP class)
LLQNADGLSIEIGGEWVTLRCANALVENHSMSFSSQVVHTFSNPNISYLLFMAGILGIAMELYHPGAIFPGVLGAICILLAFISFQIVPINVGGVLLMLVGAAMLVAEAFVPSFGALGIGGAIAVVIGGILMVDDVDPNLFAADDYGVSPWAMWPSVIVLVGLMGFVSNAVFRLRRRPKISGKAGMIGQICVLLTDVDEKSGRVKLGTETWAARSATPLQAKSRARIVRIEGLLLHVEACAEDIEV